MTLQRVTRLLFGSKIRVVAALLAVVVVSVGAGVLGAPSVDGVDNRFAAVNDTTTTIESDLRISNPNPVGVQLGGTTVDYAISMNDIAMAEGTRNGVSVERGNSTLNLTTRVANERIPAWWTSHVRNGERTTVRVNAAVHSSLVGGSVGAPTFDREVTTDVSSAFNSTETRAIDAGQPLVSDPVLYLNETSGSWGTVTDSETPIDMSFVVYNPNPYPIAASSIGYDVAMNDVAVGSGSSERSVVIPPGETRTIDATTVIRNQRLDEWWVTHLERDQVTDMEIQFYARFDLSGGGGDTVQVPLDTVNHTIETDVFGNKAETDAPERTGGNGTTGGESAGDGTGQSGDEATDEPTATATEGETETDRDILGGGGREETATNASTGPESTTDASTETDDDLL